LARREGEREREREREVSGLCSLVHRGVLNRSTIVPWVR
jgi:hypothetical protein